MEARASSLLEFLVAAFLIAATTISWALLAFFRLGPVRFDQLVVNMLITGCVFAYLKLDKTVRSDGSRTGNR